MGAEVIKVEQIGGDPYRGLAKGIGSARVNAGKQSISLDLKSEAGREIVLKLVKDADVLIHNYRPGVPERLGFGYEQVAALNPQIIYLQSNGYGPDGPGSQRPSTHPMSSALDCLQLIDCTLVQMTSGYSLPLSMIMKSYALANCLNRTVLPYLRSSSTQRKPTNLKLPRF